MVHNEAQDWTTGPAKLAAAIVLGGACIVGLAWSISTRRPGAAEAGSALVMRGPGEGGQGADRQGGEGAGGKERRGVARRININSAGAAEIELLPGIGPALARRIVADREERGAFRSVNELDRVSGIGPRIIEQLRDKVTVE